MHKKYYIEIEDIYYSMKRKYTSSIFYCCKLVINFLIFVEAEYAIFEFWEAM